MSTPLTPGSVPLRTTAPAAPTTPLPAGLVSPVEAAPVNTAATAPAPSRPAASHSAAGHPAHPVPLVPPGERRRHRTPLAWLPWALLAALLAVLALALLVGTLAGGGADDARDGATSRSTGVPTVAGGPSHTGVPATGPARRPV